MKRLTHITFTALICVLFLFSCKAKKGAESGISDTEKSSSEEKFQILYFEAQKEKAIENFDKSYEKFQASLEFNDKEDAVYYELSKLDTLNGNFGSALDRIKTAASLAPNNLWYARLQADIEVETGDFSNGINTLKSIINRDPKDVLYRDKLASLALYNEDYKTALSAYNEIENIIGVNEDLTRQKYEVYRRTGDKEKGLLELRKLSNSSPNNLSYLRNIAAHYSETGEPNKGLEVYERIVSIDPNDGDTQLALAEIYSAQGKIQKSNTALEKGFSSVNSSLESKLQILISIIDSKDPNVDQQKLVSLLQEAHPKEGAVWKISGDLAYESGENKTAIGNYKKALELHPNDLNLWLHISSIEFKTKDFEALNESSKNAQLLFPLQPEFYLYEGLALEQLGETQQSISVLKSGKGFVVSNNVLKSKFLKALGNSYHKEKDFLKSDESFQKGLEIHEVDAFIKNDYAYCLAERKQNLKNAESLIKSATTLIPNHPELEDTYSFVLFQSGELELAQKWITKALSNGGDTVPSILEHAGDIESELGNKPEALKHWNKAKVLGGSSDLLERKIEDEKYITE